MSQQLKTRIFFCGGAGLNIGTKFGATREDVCFVDGSDANVSHHLPKDKVLLIPGVQGGGSDRSYMLPFARKFAPTVLDRFEPGVFNIVVFSLGGASGSTIGPVLMAELLKGGHPTVGVVIGCVDAMDKIDNSINTMKTLEGIAVATGSPVIVHFTQNNPTAWADMDDEAMFAIDSLLSLTDQQNDRLDVRDIHNWVFFNKRHAVEPQLCTMYIETDRKAALGVLDPISIASLYTDVDQIAPFSNAYNQTVGVARNDAKLGGDTQLHFVINSVGVEGAVSGLNDEKTKLVTMKSKGPRRKGLVSVDDNADEAGFVV
jgi:hypothetical protein